MLRLPSFSLPHKPIYLAILLLIPLSSILAFYGYRYFTLAHPEQAVLPEIQAIFDSNSAVKDDPSPTPEPTPEPTLPPSPKPLPTGKQVYRYSHGDDVVGPKLQVVTIDPFDPKPGQTITITATIKHDSPVTSATAILVTDNQSNNQPMQLIDGSDTDGTWTTEYTLDDTYLYTYQLNFELASSTGDYQGGMTYRP